VQVAQGDAAAFDPKALFGVEKFERIFISYALSMIPGWQGSVAEAAGKLAPGGRLAIVDFGDQAALPRPFRAALARWLALFSVHPRRELERELAAFATARGLALRFTPLYRRYAFLAELEAPPTI
jgi:S-adenosylmethionine-diacylgycerolhomoserine-N-methlytransferase